MIKQYGMKLEIPFNDITKHRSTKVLTFCHIKLYILAIIGRSCRLLYIVDNGVIKKIKLQERKIIFKTLRISNYKYN